MELTLDEALKKGIEAHKTGHIQDADKLYNAILQVQPKHPDTNHNMGVLAVGVGKIQEALPFFKIAVEANPSVDQFWLSYINALIRLGCSADAQAVFDQAKDKGVSGAPFDQLEQQLVEKKVKARENSTTEVEGSSSATPDMLHTIKLDKALGLAKEASTGGGIEEKKHTDQDTPQNLPKYNQALVTLDSSATGTTLLSQDPPPKQLQFIFSLYTQGQLEQALYNATELLAQFPHSIALYNIAGASNVGLMKYDAAIESFKQILRIKPDFADAYNNMGIALNNKGDPDAAIDSYRMAVLINARYSEAYSNMGIAQRNKGNPDAAIDSCKKALKINPDFAEAYNNMGNAQKDKGDLDAAIDSCKQALTINPEYADAYINMGNTLNVKGDIAAAADSYEHALKINPNSVEAAWNLSGLAENISDAKSWIEYCLQIDKSHLEARLTLSALRFYEGDKSDFNHLMHSSLKVHPFMRSFAWAFELPKLPELYFHRWALFDDVVRQSAKDRPFYEFGVWRGESFRYLIKTFKKGFGFDTFEGLPEDWHNMAVGSYSSDGNMPKIEGGEFIAGKFADTLPTFFSESRPMAAIINFDADLYSSTICALNYSRPVMDQHTILIFDEFIINKNWEKDEYKALNEFCLQNSYTYEVLAISFFTKQVAIKLVGI